MVNVKKCARFVFFGLVGLCILALPVAVWDLIKYEEYTAERIAMFIAGYALLFLSLGTAHTGVGMCKCTCVTHVYVYACPGVASS